MSSADALIRPISIRDLKKVMEIERASFSTNVWEVEDYLDLLEQKDAGCLIAKIDGEMVGCCWYEPSDPEFVRADLTMDMVSLAVAEEHRRKGVAKELALALERTVWVLGYRAIQLEVRKDNPGAQALYAGLGYFVCLEVTGYYEDDIAAICMKKRLTPPAWV